MDKSKRNLAKAMSVAGAGVAVWNKPAVNSVSLPAHAQTTGCNSVTLAITGVDTDSIDFVFCNPNPGSCNDCIDCGTGGGTTPFEKTVADLAPGTYWMSFNPRCGDWTLSCCDAVETGTGEDGCISFSVEIDTDGSCALTRTDNCIL